jgi:predicted nucleic acid-binding protein
MPSSVYWDACVFIDLLQQTAGRYDACEDCRQRAEKGELILITSAITIAEVNKLPSLGSLPEVQSRVILEFFENSYIVLRQVDRAVAEKAHELTRTHGLMPMDAVHVATALAMQVDVFLTYDTPKGRRKGLLRHNGTIGNPPLKIEMPTLPTPGPLFGNVK